MRILFKFPYPKLLLLLVMVVISYGLFSNDAVQAWVRAINPDGYAMALVAGVLFTFGFTTPIAIGVFAVLNPGNIFLAAFIGALGAVMGDLLIFHLIRFSFMDEFTRLSKTPLFKKINKEITFTRHKKLKNYLLFACAGLIISSPLPDELGVTMLAGLTHIKPHVFAIISFCFNFLGILAIFLLSS